MHRALPALLLTLPLAVSASADAATTWVVKGAGWGHGIGMSQYGARGLAQEGKSYREILGHYYTGTDVGHADTQTIRVLLQQNRHEVAFTGATRAAGNELHSDETYFVRAKAGGLELRDRKSKSLGIFTAATTAPLTIGGPKNLVRLGGTAINGIKDGTYRGGLELRPSVGGGMTVVNALSLDDYVMGVVPGEMPSIWEPEALKAQAVAARSYALATDAGGDVFDQYPDTRSQVYRGVNGEASTTNAAVVDTAGEVVKWGGRVATTYFFSSSGGHTENVENVFYAAAPSPYLKGVDDPTDAASPRHRWQLTFTQKQIEAKLRPYLSGKLRAIKVRKRGVSPRIVAADVVGSKGTRSVTGTQLRQALGANDNWMTFKRVRVDATQATNAKELGLAGFVFGGGRGIAGNVAPARTGAEVVVEQLRRGHWKPVDTGRVKADGDFRVHLRLPGTYRVKAAGVVGPAVRVS